ncbi:MAG: TolC family protein [Spirosomataceae bacterium]
MKRFLILYFSFLPYFLSAQTERKKVFSYIDFYQLVLTNHPVVKQADLTIDYAQADLMMAKGQFDPKLESNFDRKSINNKEYYSHLDYALKVPVWGGIDLKVGREQNAGERLNPELSDNISIIGLSVPLGRGLLIDQRRSVLLQSRIYQNMAVAERQKLVNKIMFSAAKDYWEWYYAFRNYELQKEGYQLAKDRLDFIRTQVSIGEKAGRDSVEASITVLSRSAELEQAKLDFTNYTLYLSNYLWSSDGLPLEIPEDAVPPAVPSRSLSDEQLQDFLRRARLNHPDLLKLQYKMEQLKVEERFAKEFLKPKVDINLNAIDSPSYTFSDYSLLRTNQKVGVTFEFPLFLRKERGKIQQVQIKQQETSLEQRQVTREILNEVTAFYNEAIQLQKQLQIQQLATQNQEILVQAEIDLFNMGESSLFLINARESKLIEMRAKVESIKSKFEKSIAAIAYAAGQQDFNE